MGQNPHQEIKALLGSRVIGYLPFLAVHFQSVNAGLLLSQLLFWTGKGRKSGWIYKTVNDMYWETGLTRYQQETAIKILKDYGVLEVKRKGVPATRHFRVDVKKLEEIIGSSVDFPQLEGERAENQLVDNPATITETTPKNTSQSTLTRRKNYDASGVVDIRDILEDFMNSSGTHSAGDELSES